MSGIRLLAGQILSGIAVLLALLNDSGETTNLGLPLMTIGISAFIFAVVAFFITVEKGSALIAGLLTLQGTANAYAAHVAGATVGVYFGILVLAFGLTKFGVTLWSRAKNGSSSSNMVPAVSSRRTAVSRSVIAVIMIAVVAVAAGIVTFVTLSSGPSSGSCSTSTGQTIASTPIPISIYSGAVSSANPPGYTPDSITLVIGVNNTVTWTNNDAAAHTVTSTSAPACGQFDSGRMNPGATYTHTFTVSGTYQYHCSYHNWMTGTITVKES